MYTHVAYIYIHIMMFYSVMKMESGRVASMQIQMFCVPGNLLPLYSSGVSYLLVQAIQKLSAPLGSLFGMYSLAELVILQNYTNTR